MEIEVKNRAKIFTHICTKFGITTKSNDSRHTSNLYNFRNVYSEMCKINLTNDDIKNNLRVNIYGPEKFILNLEEYIIQYLSNEDGFFEFSDNNTEFKKITARSLEQFKQIINIISKDFLSDSKKLLNSYQEIDPEKQPNAFSLINHQYDLLILSLKEKLNKFEYKKDIELFSTDNTNAIEEISKPDDEDKKIPKLSDNLTVDFDLYLVRDEDKNKSLYYLKHKKYHKDKKITDCNWAFKGDPDLSRPRFQFKQALSNNNYIYDKYEIDVGAAVKLFELNNKIIQLKVTDVKI